MAAKDCEPVYLIRLLQVFVWLSCAIFSSSFYFLKISSFYFLPYVYIFRVVSQAKLRISLAEKTLLTALGQAAVYSEEHSKPPSDIQSPQEEVIVFGHSYFISIPCITRVSSKALIILCAGELAVICCVLALNNSDLYLFGDNI